MVIQTEMKKQTLTIIIPVYNEERRIKNCINQIKLFRKHYNYYETKLVFVNDGSTDNTINIIEFFKEDWIQVYYLNKNYGKGCAVKKGLQAVKHGVIMILDCDLSIKPINIILQGKIPKNTAIIGHRLQRKRQPLYRILLGKCWQVLVFIRTGYLGDTQAPYKILNVNPILFGFLKVDGFAYDVELIKILKESNVKIIRQKVIYDNNEDSKVTIKKTIRMFFDLLKI